MAKKKKLQAKPATAKKTAKPAPKPASKPAPPKEPTMAKKKSAPKPAAVIVKSAPAPRPTVVVTKSAARKAPKKPRSLLQRVLLAAAAGLVTGVALFYADKIPWVGTWMHGGDETLADDTRIPIRAAIVYGAIGGLSTWLTYKVTKDTTAAAGPAGVTATMVGFEVYRHFTTPSEETEGLGDPQPYGQAGTQAGSASTVATPTFFTDADGVVYSWNGPGTTPQQVQGRIPSIAGRPARPNAPGGCDCPPGRACGKPACTPRPAGCPSSSTRPGRAPACNVWASPAERFC